MDSEMAAAPPTKRPRFSIDPDLEVEVEGEVFNVHSFVLMSQSLVFRQMLTGGMCEAETGRISLAGKTKAEFMEFLCHLQSPGSGTPPELTFDVAKWLVAWADEYGVPVLKTRCEETLVNEGKLGWDTLELATKFRLEELRQSSVFEIANDVFLHRHRLLELLTQPMWEISDDEDDKDVDKPIGEASEKTEEFVAGTEKASEATAAKQDEEEVGQEEDEHTIFMCLILPRVYEALFLEPPKLDELSSCLSVRALWPIVVRALELADGWRDSEEVNYVHHPSGVLRQA